MRAIFRVCILGAVFGTPAAAQVPSSSQLTSVVAIWPQMPADAPTASDNITIVIGGDLGFGGSALTPTAAGARRHGAVIPFDVLTAELKPLLIGDVVFANLETVVSDRADLSAVDKAFNFRSHPSAIRHMVGLGVNAVSTANNHAIDYGDAGLLETLRHLELIRAEGGLQAFPGIGLGRGATLLPHAVTTRGGQAVNIAAIGIGGGMLGVREAATRPTMATYGSAADLSDATAALAAAGGDVRMLSVHYGMELQVRPSAADEQRLRSAALAADAQIVAGHHAHVAAGVQQASGRFLFYGLGNLLHPGMQDMGRHGICRDYGLLARIHLGRIGERFEVRAIEAVTLADMQATARPRTGEDGRSRINVLNHLAAGLDRPGIASGVRFMARDDGTGLWCAAGAERDNGHIGSMCRQHAEPPQPAPDLTRRIAASCGAEQVARARPTAPLEAASVLHAGSRAAFPTQSRDWRDAAQSDLR